MGHHLMAALGAYSVGQVQYFNPRPPHEPHEMEIEGM